MIALIHCLCCGITSVDELQKPHPRSFSKVEGGQTVQTLKPNTLQLGLHPHPSLKDDV